MSFLSEEVRLELQEAYEQQLANQDLDAAITEAISEELNLAVKAIKNLEAPAYCSPDPSTSRAAAGKRKFEDKNDNDVFQNLPPAEEIAAVPSVSSRGKDMGLARKAIRRPSRSIRSLLPTPSDGSSSPDPEDVFKEVNQELQLRAEFRQRMDGKRLAIKKKIKTSDDLISRIKGEKKSIRTHRENLREQIRLLDEQELSLDRSERSVIESRQKYEDYGCKV